MESNDFLRLLVNSNCLIGNSSAGIRECSYLGVPVVNIGTRQNNRKRGDNVIDVPHNENKIRAAIEVQILRKQINSEPIYGYGNAGFQIAKTLAEVPLTFHKTITY